MFLSSGTVAKVIANPSPLAGEGGARLVAVGGRGGVPSRSDLLARAKWMRLNPTEAEKRLWTILRAKRLTGFKFRRQVIIDSYIVDFVNFEHRLTVEADGSQHAESEYDKRRDAYLKKQGFKVLRFWNNDILKNSEAVAEAIWHALQAPPLPSGASRLPPSPAKGEGIESASNV
jgi:very-short-patch-repair endonuclease